MNIREERSIFINVTPKILRKLADKIERDFPKKTIGDSTACETWWGDDGLRIVFHGDQGAFEDHRSGNESKWI